MDNIKVFLENGIETAVNGLFYIFNSKYYFMYTQGELLDNEYVQLYVVQVCKEMQNTPTGTVDTGNMLGVEISNPDEWSKVQQSITKIVDDKKNNTVSSEIKYLPMSMISKLKILTKNKFKLMKRLIEENFNVNLSNNQTQPAVPQAIPLVAEPIVQQPTPQIPTTTQEDPNVIIDYRTKYFEEQEKNQQLEEKVKSLEEKLNTIKGICNN